MRTATLPFLLLLSFCTPKGEQPSEVDTVQLLLIESPGKGNHSLPYLIQGEDDRLYLSWVEKGDSNQAFFNYAQWNNGSWESSELIASGNDWFVNWADYPMIAIDQEGNKIAHYLAKSASGTYSYDVNITLKPSDSLNWSQSIIPHDDGTPTEHGFVTMLPMNDGTFQVAWLDGRNTGGGSHDHNGDGSMTIRTAVLSMDGALNDQVELDSRVCDCCQTTGVSTPSGPLFAYRDRSVDEVRDMAFVSLGADGWSEPRLVAQDNWNIAACPVNGPRAAQYGDVTAIAWYSGALSRPIVKVAFSNDSSFTEPIIIDSTDPLGRVDIVMINETTAVVSWLDGGSKASIKYRMVYSNGSMSPVQVVSETSEARGGGFPQMEYHNQQLFFAWTNFTEATSTIKIAMVKPLVSQ